MRKRPPHWTRLAASVLALVMGPLLFMLGGYFVNAERDAARLPLVPGGSVTVVEGYNKLWYEFERARDLLETYPVFTFTNRSTGEVISSGTPDDSERYYAGPQTFVLGTVELPPGDYLVSYEAAQAVSGSFLLVDDSFITDNVSNVRTVIFSFATMGCIMLGIAGIIIYAYDRKAAKHPPAPPSETTERTEQS